MAIRNNNNALCSPRRAETFPHGLRVLVVDADLTWLKIIAKMLKKCFYEVTTCCLAREALNILCERKDGFDIVISDVNMPDMDGFKLLEYVGLEMDLPVIMMSVDGETSRVMKGIQHGACDYLLKPIRMKELRNIWQHVVRKKISEVNDIEGLKGIEKLQVMRSGISDQSDDGFFFSGDDQNLVKKRKGFEYKHNDKEFADDPSLVKKTRVVWNVELHEKFVKAVNHIGIDKIGPKKILDLMNIPWLTRENVASHLQKYRLYLSRLQEECDLKVSFSGIEHSKLPPKEPAGNAIIENDNPKNYESEIGSIHSLLMLESERAISSDICEIQKATSSSGTDLIRSFESVDANHSTLSSIIPPQCSWYRNVPGVQIRQEHSPNFDIKNDLNDLNHVVFPSLHNQIYLNNLPSTHSMYTTPFNTEINNIPCIETNAPTECSNQYITRQTPGVAIGHCPILSNSYITTCFPSEKITRSTWSTKNQAMDQILANDLSYVWHLPYLESQYKECSEDFSNCSNSELLTDVPPFFYDETKLKYESHSESHRNIL